METLFQYLPSAQPKNKLGRKTPDKDIPMTIIDPRKAHIIAIQLRGLAISTDEVCEALLEGDYSNFAQVYLYLWFAFQTIAQWKWSKMGIVRKSP